MGQIVPGTLLVLLGLLPAPAAERSTAEARPFDFSHTMQAVAREPVRIYLDCQTTGCDQEFFQTELTWVDWVRDRQDADVHVIITSQTTGGGGRLYDMSFQGRDRFPGESFTLTHSSPADATADDRRRGILQTLRLGLTRFAADSPVAERLQVVLAPAGREGAAPGDEAAPDPEREDPWDFWVFSISTRASLNGESQSGSQSYTGSLSATRTTEDWKVRVSLNGNYRSNRFELPDRTVKSITRSYTGTGLVARSVTDRWSAGLRVRAQNSTFSNYDLALETGPAVEFSIFPYSESTRRALTAEYGLGVSHYDYTEETLFDRFSETRLEQSLTVSLDLRQPWGSVNMNLSGNQFLHDLQRNRLTAGGGVNLRLFRGFSLNVNGFYSRVRNQLNIPKRGASEEEVLLRRRQLETSYSYFTSFGITYRFGSIFSDIVNPRMDSSGGGTVIFF